MPNKEKIKNYFLITQGLDIQEVIEFHKYLFLTPYGYIKKNKPYQEQTVSISTALDLSDNKIDDITPLQNLTQLTKLDLSDNKIEDITPLQNLTQLKFLDIRKNTAPKSQIEDLTTALPNCRIFHDFK